MRHGHRGIGHHHLLELVAADLGELRVLADDGVGGARLPGEERDLAEEPAGVHVLQNLSVLGLQRHLAGEHDVEGLAGLAAAEEHLARSLRAHHDALADPLDLGVVERGQEIHPPEGVDQLLGGVLDHRLPGEDLDGLAQRHCAG